MSAGFIIAAISYYRKNIFFVKNRFTLIAHYALFAYHEIMIFYGAGAFREFTFDFFIRFIGKYR